MFEGVCEVEVRTWLGGKNEKADPDLNTAVIASLSPLMDLTDVRVFEKASVAVRCDHGRDDDVWIAKAVVDEDHGRSMTPAATSMQE